MRKVILVLPAIVIAGVMVFAALWAWQGAPDWVATWTVSRPELTVWAVRSAAIGIAAAAQAILLAPVGATIFGRGPVDSAMTFTAATICAVALVSAVACGLAGR